MKNAPYETCLSDFQWWLVEPLLPKPARTGRPRTCLRRVLNAVIYVTKSGCPWRLLPKDFPSWNTVYHHFRAWTRLGLLEAHPQAAERGAALPSREEQTQLSAVVIDSQTVRSAGHGGDVGYDAGKRTKGRKRFLCVDTLGYIAALFLAHADTPERAGAKVQLTPMLKGRKLSKLWADGGASVARTLPRGSKTPVTEPRSRLFVAATRHMAFTFCPNAGSWNVPLAGGYSQALYDAGIRNLVTRINAHHGLPPIGRRQTPPLLGDTKNFHNYRLRSIAHCG